MRKTLSALAAAAALALVPGASAVAEETNAAQACKQQRSTMGEATFKATYGTNKNRSNAFGKCVSKMQKAQEENRESANAQCRAERDADPAAFAQKYGTGKNGKNAFGKCVSQKAKASNDETSKAVVNAAKACKAERKADPQAFQSKYGTNENDRNAFGKCVSSKSKAKS